MRVLDFERGTPSRLSEEHQFILILTYRERRDQCHQSDATGISVRALAYKLPPSAHALASFSIASAC